MIFLLSQAESILGRDASLWCPKRLANINCVFWSSNKQMSTGFFQCLKSPRLLCPHLFSSHFQERSIECWEYNWRLKHSQCICNSFEYSQLLLAKSSSSIRTVPPIHPFKWRLFTISKKLCFPNLENKVIIFLALVSNLRLLSLPEQIPLLGPVLYSFW